MFLAGQRENDARIIVACGRKLVRLLPRADFEALSHQVQKEIGMSEYHVPVLIGYSSGATVVYAALVESPPGTFAGALSLGFCPDQDFAGAALCPGAGLHYRANERGERKDLNGGWGEIRRRDGTVIKQ